MKSTNNDVINTLKARIRRLEDKNRHLEDEIDDLIEYREAVQIMTFGNMR